MGESEEALLLNINNAWRKFEEVASFNLGVNYHFRFHYVYKPIECNNLNINIGLVFDYD